jgi:hypothetical protein
VLRLFALFFFVFFSLLDELANSVSAFCSYFLVEFSAMCLRCSAPTFLTTFPSSFFNCHFTFFCTQENSPPTVKTKNVIIMEKCYGFILFHVLFFPRLVCGLLVQLLKACFSSFTLLFIGYSTQKSTAT